MRTTLLLSMFILAAAVCAAKNDARATITMKNGTVKENVEIKLPKGWDSKLKIKSGNTEETLPADSVDHFLLWHNDNPEQKAVIKYLGVGRYNRKKDESTPNDYKVWMSLRSAGDHLSYWISFNKIKLKSNAIKYEIGSDTHYFLKRGAEYAIMIPVNPMFMGRTNNWLKAFLRDDPELVKNITDKGYTSRKQAYHQGTNYNPFLLEEIAVDYNPKR